MIPPRLLDEVEQYEKVSGTHCECAQEGEQVRIRITGYRIPSKAYTTNTTDMLVLNTVVYPKTAFDMFYTPDCVRLRDGNAMPSGVSPINLPEGSWLQWSVHPYRQVPWDPTRDGFCTFMRYVAQRFRNGD